jgi:hypothetical protein
MKFREIVTEEPRGIFGPAVKVKLPVRILGNLGVGGPHFRLELFPIQIDGTRNRHGNLLQWSVSTDRSARPWRAEIGISCLVAGQYRPARSKNKGK